MFVSIPVVDTDGYSVSIVFFFVPDVIFLPCFFLYSTKSVISISGSFQGVIPRVGDYKSMELVVGSFDVVTTSVDDCVSLKSAMVGSFDAAITGVGTGIVKKPVMGSGLMLWLRVSRTLYPQCKSVSPNTRILISYSDIIIFIILLSGFSLHSMKSVASISGFFRSANAMVDSSNAAIIGAGTGNVMKSVLGSGLWVLVGAPVTLYPQCKSVSPNARILISYSW